MKAFVLWHSSTATTGKELMTWLKERGADVSGGTTLDVYVDVLIRWGSQVPVTKKPGRVLNKGPQIKLASNKLEALMKLQEEGILIPQIWSGASKDIEFPVLGRLPHHTQGLDIALCMQYYDIRKAIEKDKNYYFVKYVPTATEYRFHVMSTSVDDGYKIIKISQKIEEDPEKYKPWLRNHDNGFIYKVAIDKPSVKARYAAMQSVESLGLNFGAVDVIVGDDGRPYTLEVNTAPGLTTDSSLKAYGKRFLAVLGIEYLEEE